MGEGGQSRKKVGTYGKGGQLKSGRLCEKVGNYRDGGQLFGKVDNSVERWAIME